MVSQKNDGGTNNYVLTDTASIHVGTVFFDYWAQDSTHDISLNNLFSKFNLAMPNDGTSNVILEANPVVSITNLSDPWKEDFTDLVDSIAIDEGEISWEIDTSATKPDALNCYVGTRGRFIRFQSMEGEASWTSEWVKTCDNAVHIAADVREAGELESDDYIRFYYQVRGSDETLFWSLEDDSAINNTWDTIGTVSPVEGDYIRVVIRMRNGFDGTGIERYDIDNIRFEKIDCYQTLNPMIGEVTNTSEEISWNPEFDANNYRIRYRVKGVTTWSTAFSDSVFVTTSSELSTDLSSLLENTTYEVQVRSECDTLNSPYSTIKQFTTDYAGNPLADCFVESGGSVTMEAENYSNNLYALSTVWQHYTGLGSNDDLYDGMLLPEASASNGNTGLETTGPRLDYNISFSTPGTYRVRVNMAKQNSVLTAGSVLVGKNGQCISCRGTGMNANNEKFIWQGNADGTQVEFVVEEPGVQTFNLWMRKDGTAVNKIHLTTSETNPGINVAESTRNSCGTIANAINCIDMAASDLILNDRVATGIYEANSQIESTAQVTLNNEVLMQATDSVVLKVGFQVENGATFNARIRP
ncbi:MAG: 3-coathanger stack domain-containing protein, partial [Bacteroidota bacterium]